MSDLEALVSSSISINLQWGVAVAKGHLAVIFKRGFSDRESHHDLRQPSRADTCQLTQHLR